MECTMNAARTTHHPKKIFDGLPETFF